MKGDLPIIVAACGHRDLVPGDATILTAAVRGIFERLSRRYPTSPLLLLTPLAVGADRLIARVAAEMKIPYRVPMPFEEEAYRKDFDAEQNAEFTELLAGAQKSYVVQSLRAEELAKIPESERRSEQYAMIAAHLARSAHVLIALWNGAEQDTTGGTYATIKYRLYGVPERYREPLPILDAPDTGPVYWVAASRVSKPTTEWAVGTLRLRLPDEVIEEEKDPFRPLYENIERFNRDEVRCAVGSQSDAIAERVCEIARGLADHFQRRYHFALYVIFGGTCIAAGALAATGASNSPIALLLYGFTIGIVVVPAYLFADRGHWKDRFIEYRALEIGLSVQRIWDLAALQLSAADYYLRLQRTDLDWIRRALRTINVLDPGPAFDPATTLVAVHDFVTGQRSFFQRAGARDEQAWRTFDRIGKVAFAIAFLLTLTLGVSTLVVSVSKGHHNQSWPYSFLIIRILAVISIVAAVLHEYPRRRAFHAQARRYAAMFQIYDRALSILDEERRATELPLPERGRTAKQAIHELGIESLAENAEWVIMHRELPIELLQM